MSVTAFPVFGGFSYRGAKKGAAGARTPVEAPDTLKSTSYAHVLDLLSEGEIKGLVNGLQSVYLNKTPLQNSDGSLNFAGVGFEIRHGTQFQTHIPGFPAAENPMAVGVELVYGQPWVTSSTNLQLSAVNVTLGVNGLSSADKETGDVNGYRVDYAIDLQTDAGPWVEIINSAFDGKTTSSYRRTHRIDLPTATAGWQVRVRRLTEQSNSLAISDTTIIDTYTEVIDGKLRYPMSALGAIKIDASQFSSIPTRSYDVYGRIIKVPSNYDPETRVYTGIWDGLFKNAYTNNPAWIFYDIVSNDRYGLGRQIPTQWVQKWELYRIGRYCDELVPDGRGGMEPRFTCNAYLQSPGDAFRVLQDMVNVFRGIVYWAAGNAIPVADMPRDVAYTYTQANVIGKFVYTGSRRKDRPTMAVVSYNDPQDQFRQKTVMIQDAELIARYGVRKVELTSFGCTSEGQATRIAKWALLTTSRETRGVTFTVGLDGTVCAPGQIIQVADNAFAGRRIGGRIVSATRSEIQLDSAIEFAYGDLLTVMMPDGTVQTRKISQTTGGGLLLTADDTTRTLDMTTITADANAIRGNTSVSTVIVESPFTEAPAPESVWGIEAGLLKLQLFTVTGVTQSGSQANQFHISAIQHEPGKFDGVDFGTKLEDRPVTVVPPSVQPPPTNVRMSDYSIIFQGIESKVGVIEWDEAQGTDFYNIEWRRDNSNWVTVPNQLTTRAEIPNIYSGTYTARVRAVNAIGAPSLWVYSTPVELTGTVPAPPQLTRLTATGIVFGIQLEWGFPNVPNIIERTEIWYGPANDRNSATKLTDLAYPQKDYVLQGLAGGVEFYFWGRLVDKNGLPGDWLPLAANNGVRGVSSTDASDILDYIAGQIDETLLSQELRTEIGKIPLLDDQVQAMQTIVTQTAAATGQNTALIQQETTARTAADSALAQDITTVQAAAGNALATSQIAQQAIADTNGQLAALVTIKAQVTSGGIPYIAGIGVGVENNQGVITTQILLSAQRVAVLNEANGSSTVPFVIQNGQTIINDAIIGNASIGSAKIADWLQSDAVNGLNQRVFALNMRTGEMQFNGTGGGATRMTQNNAGIRVYANNVLRVKLGVD